MVSHVVTIESSEKVSTAIDLMAEHCISSILVTRGESLLGIITEKDIINKVVRLCYDPNSINVIDVMSSSLYMVEPKTPITEAGRIMTDKKIKKLPVVVGSAKKLVGILSITDLAKVQSIILESSAYSARSFKDPIRSLLNSDENQTLEFKSTLRWDLQRKCVNPSIERAIIKSICAFLNSSGGDLLIGVADNRSLLGLEFDYKTLKYQNRDGFENKLMTLISTLIGDSSLRHIKSSFSVLDGLDVCRVLISPSIEPVFLHESGQEVFFVRTGNSSRPFSVSDTVRYVREHWK